MFNSALTIDLEDWYHPELVRNHANGTTPARVEAAVAPILDLLENRGVKATFFVVGDLLEPHAELIQQIAGAGHEIACHGMSHKPLWELTAESFGAELEAFHASLQRVLGPDARATGYRAPTFSVDHSTAWAIDTLAAHGYEYDSSIFPLKSPLYGVSGAPVGPYRVSSSTIGGADPAGAIVEIPPTVFDVGPLRVPVGGGIYLRFLPGAVLRRLLQNIAGRRPVIFYLHPWEFDSETPRVPLPLASRIATYHGMHAGTLRKLGTILDTITFTTMREVISQWRSRAN